MKNKVLEKNIARESYLQNKNEAQSVTIEDIRQNRLRDFILGFGSTVAILISSFSPAIAAQTVSGDINKNDTVVQKIEPAFQRIDLIERYLLFSDAFSQPFILDALVPIDENRMLIKKQYNIQDGMIAENEKKGIMDILLKKYPDSRDDMPRTMAVAELIAMSDVDEQTEKSIFDSVISLRILQSENNQGEVLKKIHQTAFESVQKKVQNVLESHKKTLKNRPFEAPIPTADSIENIYKLLILAKDYQKIQAEKMKSHSYGE